MGRTISADGTVGGDHLPILQKHRALAPIIKAWVEPDTSSPRHPDEVKLPPGLVHRIIPSVRADGAAINELDLVAVDPQWAGEFLLAVRSGLESRLRRGLHRARPATQWYGGRFAM